MANLWTWRGIYFGYKEGDNLWTYEGRHVGRFADNEVYSPEGNYLGEMGNEQWLITDTHKKSKKRSAFIKFSGRTGRTPYINYTGFAMLPGFEDFPSPQALPRH